MTLIILFPTSIRDYISLSRDCNEYVPCSLIFAVELEINKVYSYLDGYDVTWNLKVPGEQMICGIYKMQHRSIIGEGINWYYQYFKFPSSAEWRCVPGTDWSMNCWRASCSRDRRRYFKEKIRKCSSVREYSLVIPLFFVFFFLAQRKMESTLFDQN